MYRNSSALRVWLRSVRDLSRLPRRALAGAVLCLFAMLGCCVGTSAEPYALSPALPAIPRADIVYVIAGSWHTEIALPVVEIGGPLARLADRFRGARYLIFGWGARGFYMAKHPDLGDVLRAAVPGPAVMLVIPLWVPPTTYIGPNNAWVIAVSRAGAVRLSQFLWNNLAKNGAGELERAGPGPYPQSVFYTVTGTYDAADTCNTWTADALRAAGLPVTVAGVVFAGQLVDQLPPLTASRAVITGSRRPPSRRRGA
jgi:uncharacterized protein (TIGR02117 family)